MLICTAEILPIAHPSAETGPPQPPVVELARVTDRGIRKWNVRHETISFRKRQICNWCIL